MVEPYVPDIGGSLSRFMQTQAAVQSADAISGFRDQQMREKAHAIVLSSAKSMWNQIKDIPDPAQQQQRANELREAMRPWMQTALGPMYKESPGPVNLDQLKAAATMDFGGQDQGAFAPVQTYVPGPDGKPKLVYAFPDRNKTITPTEYEVPESFSSVGAGSAGTYRVGDKSNRVGSFIPKTQEERDGLRPDTPPPPGVVYPTGQGQPSDALPATGGKGVVLRFDDDANALQWAYGAVEEDRRRKQQQPPAAPPSGGYQPEAAPQPPAPGPTPPPMPAPQGQPQTFSPERPVYPGGASNPRFSGGGTINPAYTESRRRTVAAEEGARTAEIIRRDQAQAELQRKQRQWERENPPPPTGYRPTPDGLERTPGGPEDPKVVKELTEIKDAPQARARVTELRKEFAGLPEVKIYKEARPVYDAARDASTRDTKSADLNMIYAVAKLMDPGSVVRESESAMVVAAGSPAERMMGLWNSILGGGRLTGPQRKELLAELDGRMSQYTQAYEKQRQQYGGIAQRSGVNPEDVFTDPVGVGAPAYGQQPPAGPGVTYKKGQRARWPDGSIHIFDGSDWVPMK